MGLTTAEGVLLGLVGASACAFLVAVALTGYRSSQTRLASWTLAAVLLVPLVFAKAGWMAAIAGGSTPPFEPGSRFFIWLIAITTVLAVVGTALGALQRKRRAS